MRIATPFFAALFAGIASCGTIPEGPADTDRVSGDTHAASVGASGVDDGITEGPVVPRNSDKVAFAFAAKGRFVVFADPSAASFVVFDRERSVTFVVPGAPTGATREHGDSLEQFGLAATAQQLVIDEDGQGRLLVRADSDVRLVDLADRGRVLASWHGTASPRSVSLAPDGGAFVVVGDEGIDVVPVGTVAAAADSLHVPSLRPLDGIDAVAVHWSDRFVWWSTNGKLTRVDRASLQVTDFAPTDGAVAESATSADGAVIALAWRGEGNRPGGAAIFVAGAEPLRFASPSVDQLSVDAAGTTIAWLERIEDPNFQDDIAFMHTVDVATRVHRRFRAKGSGCAIVPESLQSVGAGVVVTDASCSMGCPSVRWEHRAVTYDAKTGRVVRDTSTTEERSWNEEQEADLAAVTDVTTRLGLGVDAVARGPKKDVVIFTKPGSATEERTEAAAIARIVGTSEPIALEASTGAALSTLTISADGALVAGVVDGRARVWSAATGRALLR